jgi:hypothetical protein
LTGHRLQAAQAPGASCNLQTDSLFLQSFTASINQPYGASLTATCGEARAKFYNILTPDQRTKVEQMRAAFRQRMERRRAAQRSNG